MYHATHYGIVPQFTPKCLTPVSMGPPPRLSCAMPASGVTPRPARHRPLCGRWRPWIPGRRQPAGVPGLRL